MNEKTVEKISALNLDDLVWYIYIFISVAALYSNELEKQYIITGDKKKFTEFHSVNLVVLTIAFFVYIFFVFTAFKKYNQRKDASSLTSIIASILFLVGGGMFLYLELKSSNAETNDLAI